MFVPIIRDRAMLVRPSIPASVALLAVLTLGCRESLEPEAVVGTWSLQRVVDDPLPTVLYSTEHVVVWVTSDTIRLRADGSGTISGVRSYTPVEQGVEPQGPGWSQSDIHFRVIDGRIEIEYVCPINASCIAPPHLIARPADDGLRVDFAIGSRVPLFYSRAAAAP